MDIGFLSQQLGTLLTPLLPYLLKSAVTFGKDAVSEAGKKAGQIGWEKVEKLWKHVEAPITSNPVVAEAAKDAAQNPENEHAKAAFIWQMQKILQALPPEEIKSIQDILSTEQPVHRVTTAFGDSSIAIGGNVIDSSVSTGIRSSRRKKSNTQ